MVKFDKEITEMPEKMLRRHKKMKCSMCKEELPVAGEDSAIIVRYPKIKVAVPLCHKHYEEIEEEQIDTMARIAQINGEVYNMKESKSE